MQITFDYINGAGARYKQQVIDLIKMHDASRVCDVGGGANPLLRDVEISLDYTVLDISAAELAKAPTRYKKIQADISAENFSCDERFDVVFTKALAEHVSDGKRFHQNIFNILRPGGFATHFFPTPYALPFIVNRMVPERLGQMILASVAPRDRHLEGKFPAYYRWCGGPTRRQIRRFNRIGFRVVSYAGYFGHGYYERIPMIRNLEHLKARWLLRHPIAVLASYASVVLQKPAS